MVISFAKLYISPRTFKQLADTMQQFEHGNYHSLRKKVIIRMKLDAYTVSSVQLYTTI